MVTYVIGSVEMDSIGDLLEQGGSITNLEIFVKVDERWGESASIDFLGGWSGPRINLTAFQEDEQWAVYGKVQRILYNRRLILKPFVDDLPEGVKYGAYAVLVMGPSAIPLLLRHSGAPQWYVAAGIVYGIVTFLFILGTVVSLQSTKIYLTRSHERSKASSETIKKYAIGAITFVLGVIATKVIDRLFK